jgi:hypothetical protein
MLPVLGPVIVCIVFVNCNYTHTFRVICRPGGASQFVVDFTHHIIMSINRLSNASDNATAQLINLIQRKTIHKRETYAHLNYHSTVNLSLPSNRAVHLYFQLMHRLNMLRVRDTINIVLIIAYKYQKY